ncbi:MAG: hypothetical protein ABSA92_14500 [Candidatus Bathyarchaeia archaeon]|jgi:hypothetical protein
MKYSFKIDSVWGIPIKLHITFINHPWSLKRNEEYREENVDILE